MTTPIRTPYAHKIRYGITGAPTLTEDELDGSYAPGVGVAPVLIELVYSAALEDRPASVAAAVTGVWTRFGRREQPERTVTVHFKSGPDGWPEWLAAEARLHDPERAVSSAVVAPPTDQAAAQAALAAVETALGDTLTADAREEALAGIAAVLPPTDQAAGLREADWVVEHCPEHGCVEPLTEVCHCEIADRLRRRPAAVLPEPADRAAVLRWAADRIDATRADFPIAVQNGITWATAEMRRHAADEQPGARHVHITIHHPDPTTAHTAALCIADLIHGEYSDSLRLTITTDAPGTGAAPHRQADETPDTLAAWLYQRFMVQGVGWDDLDEGDRTYWEHHARAVRRAVARGGFKQPAAARQDGGAQ